MTTVPSSPGIPGGYEALRLLGTGTTCRVLLCRARDQEGMVALKVSARPLGTAQAMRFLEEAQVMARLRHPNILPVLDAGMTGDGHAYLACAWAPHGSFQQLLRSQTLTVPDMLRVGSALADALQTAHGQGVLHRDIKPSNVLIGAQGEPLLADFGIAADVYDHAAKGFSLPWSPPETLAGRPSGEAGDVYSLGATLYAMLASASPFEYGYRPRDGAELARLIADAPLRPINRTDVPDELTQVLARALARDPECRWYSAQEFGQALRNCQRHVVAVEAPNRNDADATARTARLKVRAAASHAPAHADAARRRTHLRRVVIAIVASSMTVLAVGVLFAALILPRTDEQAPVTRLELEGPGDPSLLQVEERQVHDVG